MDKAGTDNGWDGWEAGKGRKEGKKLFMCAFTGVNRCVNTLPDRLSRQRCCYVSAAAAASFSFSIKRPCHFSFDRRMRSLTHFTGQ